MGLRDKFKATSVTTLKNKMAQEDKMMGSDGGRAGYLEITEGSNKFRIFPAHPGGDLFYAIKVVHWGSITKDDGSSGRKPIFNARIHGGCKHDIFEEYMSKVKAYLQESGDEDAATKLKAMTDWKTGISHSNSWVCYAQRIDKDKTTFGLLEFGKLVRDGLNKIAALEDGDEPIEIDPFTDPDTGVPVIIKYTPTAKTAAQKYDVTLGKSPKPMPISDEDLEEFENKPSLASMYVGVYKMRDFDLAVEAIRNFDEANEIGFTETDDFESLVDKLKAEVESSSDADSPKKSKNTKDSKSSKKKHVEEVEEEDDEDVEENEEVEEEEEEGDLNLKKLDRQELKDLIKEKGLEITVKKSMSDDDLRKAIEKALSTSEDEEDEEEEDDEEEEVVKPAAKKSSSSSDMRSKLEEVKNRLRAGKK